MKINEEMVEMRMARETLEKTPEVGTVVEMAGIAATVEEVKYVASHNAWVVVFAAPQGKQEVMARDVVKAIEMGRMIVK